MTRIAGPCIWSGFPIDRFKPRRAVITNMHSDLDYEVLRASLPAGVIPAYDGMQLVLEQT